MFTLSTQSLRSLRYIHRPARILTKHIPPRLPHPHHLQASGSPRDAHASATSCEDQYALTFTHFSRCLTRPFKVERLPNFRPNWNLYLSSAFHASMPYVQKQPWQFGWHSDDLWATCRDEVQPLHLEPPRPPMKFSQFLLSTSTHHPAHHSPLPWLVSGDFSVS